VVATDLNTVGSIELSSGNVKKCVRASMSLLNWFPPVHDPTAPTPEQAHLLCDGCYSQNLPIKVAKKIAKFVVAVDAGWKVLWRWLIVSCCYGYDGRLYFKRSHEICLHLMYKVISNIVFNLIGRLIFTLRNFKLVKQILSSQTNSNTFYDVQSRNGIVTSIRNFFGARKIPSSSELGQILVKYLL